MALLPGWTHVADRIAKTYRFANYHETIAFVNAVAWIAHRTDHHPDLSVHFNRCIVSLSTHDAGGVTQNDLVCAARIERLSA
jgi:4a-hydroxytetrahydrobiopterin dehydratase